jgi:leucine dehydrogenase
MAERTISSQHLNTIPILLTRSVTYVPDYVANAGGIINVIAEYYGEPAERASMHECSRSVGVSPAS